ncbi:heparanase-like isoform X1 [Biomphalaria glabrata]|uniref:Heparanase-like isoform X1 n=2 Tax=Biomphalaria glabrata TaxID=6526 RepID=A0A9W2YR64_BIOGL|nr:heparanase-like isoform X1 [Biomphalaria glabrata]
MCDKMSSVIIQCFLFLFLLVQCYRLGGSHKVYPQKNIHSQEEIEINLTFSQYSCDQNFLSVAIDSSEIKNKWRGFDFSSQKLQNLAHALSPAYIRIGGTDADFLIFNPNELTEAENEMSYKPVSNYTGLKKDEQEFTLTGGVWRNMTHFFQYVGWDVIFDFNLFLRKKDLWDPSNASSLLSFSEMNGINIAAFQLGNEPNSYEHNFNFTISPSALLNDLKTLRNVLNDHPFYRSSGLFGPEVTNLGNRAGSSTYLKQFLEAGACDVMDYISSHHYYLDGRTATADDFLNPQVLDTLKTSVETARTIMRENNCPLPLALTETSSCYGGGAPNLSDRYLAGFLWLDKLGVTALNGYSRIFRQTFYSGHYALISSELEPNPDFFLSVLFKKLVEGPVLTVVKQPEKIRVYANCANTAFYPQGSIVIYFLNLRDTPVNLSLSQFADLKTDVYLLTPGDSDGLKSRFVKLNGNLLVLSGSELPPLPPRTVQGVISLEPQSFGFAVIPGAKASICIK